MAAKLTRLAHKIAIQLYLMTAVPIAVLAPGGQSGNFWIHHHNLSGIWSCPVVGFYCSWDELGVGKLLVIFCNMFLARSHGDYLLEDLCSRLF
jgi:hypothetical protein